MKQQDKQNEQDDDMIFENLTELVRQAYPPPLTSEQLARAFEEIKRKAGLARPRAMARPWLLAAAAAVLAAVTLGYFGLQQQHPLPRISTGATNYRLLRAGRALQSKAGRVKAGDVLDVRAGRLRIHGGNGVTHFIDGPAVVRVIEAQAGTDPIFVISIQSGAISILSTSATKRAEWRTQHARYEITGTTARLQVSGGEKIEVLEGQIDVMAPGLAPVSVAGGQSLRRDRIEEGPRPLSATAKQRLEDLETVSGGRTPKPPTYKSLDEIHRKKPPLSRIVLRDGSILLGHIEADGEQATDERFQYRVYTPEGDFVFPESAVDRFAVIPYP